VDGHSVYVKCQGQQPCIAYVSAGCTSEITALYAAVSISLMAVMCQAVRIEHMTAEELTSLVENQTALLGAALVALGNLAGNTEDLICEPRHIRTRYAPCV